ncbi:class I adenylate-forming enzyme family protein [Aeromicrobium sp.]|uniref:class I adenylate-forming enzyme family protein n=1 Tax=Aeromicrobium sp. TaxID=1871063 RepID=UPI002FC9CB5F
MTATSSALVEAADLVLVTDGQGETRTGAELYHAVSLLAGEMTAAGWAGGVVGHWFTNSIASIEAALAIEWIGATRVSIDPTTNSQEANSMWNAANVDGRLVDPEHGHAPTPDSLVYTRSPETGGSLIPPTEEVDPNKTYLLYPRAVQDGELLAVPISYGNWDATMRLNQALYREGWYGSGFGPDACFLTVQQLMHGTGLVGSFPFLRMGLPQIILDRFDADLVLEVLGSGRVTATMMVTAMVDRLTDALEATPRSLGKLSTLLYGGAPMSPDRLLRATTAMPDVLVQIYGRLEGGWPLTVLDQADHRSILAADGGLLIASCGRALPEAGLQIRASGEVVVRSDMVVDSFADVDGSCGLGDIGHLDADGYLFLDGRLDRMINTGYHVYPAEIEDRIREVAGVQSARVEGRPDPRRGEKVVALVVASRDDHERLQRELDLHLRATLAPYKVPREYEFPSSLGQ